MQSLSTTTVDHAASADQRRHRVILGSQSSSMAAHPLGRPGRGQGGAKQRGTEFVYPDKSRCHNFPEKGDLVIKGGRTLAEE